MQEKRTCPHCGANIADDSTPAPDIGCVPHVEERGMTLGPPVVERQGRDFLGRPFGVAGVDDVEITVIDK